MPFAPEFQVFNSAGFTPVAFADEDVAPALEVSFEELASSEQVTFSSQQTLGINSTFGNGSNSNGFNSNSSNQDPFRPSEVYDYNVSPKRLVICCDGTWQTSTSGLLNVPSNVTRLARSINRTGVEHLEDNRKRVWQQVVYYDAGIGTGDLSKMEKDRQGGFGVGFVANVIEAYNFLANNYNLGDEVMCFGFSRGAYTARAVAGLVNDIGIILPRDMQDFPDLYASYQAHDNSFQFKKSTAYREWVSGKPAEDQGGRGPDEEPIWEKRPHQDAAEASRVVKVVGVFDTVGSLGIPDLDWTRWNLKFLEKALGIRNPGFHNVHLSPYIQHAFHALALDERRKPFSPTLWDLPTKLKKVEMPKTPYEQLWANWLRVKSNKSSTEKQLNDAWDPLVDVEMYKMLKALYPHYDKVEGEVDPKKQISELEQVWFPGVHINVGGGSDDLLNAKEGDLEQIALISFAWMCEKVSPFLQLDTSLEELAVQTTHARDVLIDQILSRKDKNFGQSAILGPMWRTLDYLGLNKAPLYELQERAKEGWATGPIVDSFTGLMARFGAEYRRPGQYATGDKTGPTNEWVHPSVFYRILKHEEYKPEPFKGFSRQKRADKKAGGKEAAYEWTNGLGVAIPEYVIRPEHSFSRYLTRRDHDDAKYLARGTEKDAEGGANKFIGRIDVAMGFNTDEQMLAQNIDPFKPQKSTGFSRV